VPWSELWRLIKPGPALDLRFEQRECVIVPQTDTRIALHADVYFVASARRRGVIDDATLAWSFGRTQFRLSRWDRAVIDGRFRYPPQPLAAEVGPGPAPVTLTFTDPLIPHGSGPPPETSTLVLELMLRDGRKVRRELWRVRQTSWDEPASVLWLGGGSRA